MLHSEHFHVTKNSGRFIDRTWDIRIGAQGLRNTYNRIRIRVQRTRKGTEGERGVCLSRESTERERENLVAGTLDDSDNDDDDNDGDCHTDDNAHLKRVESVESHDVGRARVRDWRIVEVYEKK
jgi:hypothetical protein